MRYYMPKCFVNNITYYQKEFSWTQKGTACTYNPIFVKKKNKTKQIQYIEKSVQITTNVLKSIFMAVFLNFLKITSLQSLFRPFPPNFAPQQIFNSTDILYIYVLLYDYSCLKNKRFLSLRTSFCSLRGCIVPIENEWCMDSRTCRFFFVLLSQFPLLSPFISCCSRPDFSFTSANSHVFLV